MFSLLVVEDLSIVTHLRAERGMSQSQLADAIGLRATAISRIERGIVKIRPANAIKLVEALHFAGPLKEDDATDLLKFLGLGSTVFERIKRTNDDQSMSPAQARAILNHVLHRIGLETFAALANGVIAEAHAAQTQVVKMVQPPERGSDGRLYQVTTVMPAPASPGAKSTTPRARKKAK